MPFFRVTVWLFQKYALAWHGCWWLIQDGLGHFHDPRKPSGPQPYWWSKLALGLWVNTSSSWCLIFSYGKGFLLFVSNRVIVQFKSLLKALLPSFSLAGDLLSNCECIIYDQYNTVNSLITWYLILLCSHFFVPTVMKKDTLTKGTTKDEFLQNLETNQIGNF